MTAALSVSVAVWAVLFYFAMVDEINDETDDSLVEYSSDLIRRSLAGVEMPSEDNGTNNAYYIREVSEDYAAHIKWMRFRDEEKFITAMSEYESARVIYRIFKDDDGYRELAVAVPTFEKNDLKRSIFRWMAVLYICLMVLIIGLSLWVVEYNMRPFKIAPLGASSSSLSYPSRRP